VNPQARTPALHRLRSPLLIGIWCGCLLKPPLSSTKRRQPRRLKDHRPRQPGNRHGLPVSLGGAGEQSP
jgi:hypothetical protein